MACIIDLQLRLASELFWSPTVMQPTVASLWRGRP